MKNIKLFKLGQIKLIVRLALLIALVLSSCQANKHIEGNKYEAFISQAHAKGQFNGNVLIVENGKIAFQGSYGIRKIEPLDSLTLNSIFRIGSVSKQFTAMGIMKLKESGLLTYDQNIKDFIPELPYEGVTIRHLLNHVSGLPDYTRPMSQNWKSELENNNPDKFVSGNIDLIKMFAELKPKIHFEPGEKWEYSNTGYVLLASIISRVSGIPFGQFLKEQIFEPVKMTNTSVYNFVPGDDPQMPNRVYGFKTELNGIDLVSTDVHYLNRVVGDGGVYSTLEDLLKWDRILYTENLISQSTLEEAFSPTTLNNGDITNYGFGWRIDKSPSGKKVVYHTGGWNGFSAYIYREIEENNCIIYLTNNSSNYFGSMITSLENILNNLPYETPKISIRETIAKIVLNDDVDVAVKQYKNLKLNEPEAYNFSENQLNVLGYELLQLDRIKDAVEIFRLNTEEFSQSANAYDSFGDALLANRDTALALINFKKAFALDSTLNATKKKINDIEE